MTSPRLALVTGAQRGIGNAIARALACDGYDVIVNDVHATSSGEALCEQWQTTQRVLSIAADVGDEAAIDAMFDRVAEHFDRPPNVLVNNAAIQFWASLVDLDLEQWEKTLRVNMTGSFLMTQRFARRHIAACSSATSGSSRRASIINIGSGCNQLAFPKLVSYTASKGGVEMLTKASALELGEHGIRVNCVAPGSILTERTQQETDGYVEQWAPLTPMGRIGTVDDVARAVVYLASDAADFVSGQTLNVDGGLFSQAIWPRSY